MTTAASNMIKFYLSTDPIINAADKLLTGSRTVTTLLPGASSPGTTTVTVPTTVMPGTYYIGAIADTANVQPESNEGNNSLAGTIITVN